MFTKENNNTVDRLEVVNKMNGTEYINVKIPHARLTAQHLLRRQWHICTTESTTDARRSRPRPTPHCRVLPPGEFNSMFIELLAAYSRNLMTTFITNKRSYKRHASWYGIHCVQKKNTHFCFPAYILEKVTNLNENFRQNSYWNADSKA